MTRKFRYNIYIIICMYVTGYNFFPSWKLEKFRYCLISKSLSYLFITENKEYFMKYVTCGLQFNIFLNYLGHQTNWHLQVLQILLDKLNTILIIKSHWLWCRLYKSSMLCTTFLQYVIYLFSLIYANQNSCSRLKKCKLF